MPVSNMPQRIWRNQRIRAVSKRNNQNEQPQKSPLARKAKPLQEPALNVNKDEIAKLLNDWHSNEYKPLVKRHSKHHQSASIQNRQNERNEPEFVALLVNKTRKLYWSMFWLHNSLQLHTTSKNKTSTRRELLHVWERYCTFCFTWINHAQMFFRNSLILFVIRPSYSRNRCGFPLSGQERNSLSLNRTTQSPSSPLETLDL